MHIILINIVIFLDKNYRNEDGIDRPVNIFDGVLHVFINKVTSEDHMTLPIRYRIFPIIYSVPGGSGYMGGTVYNHPASLYHNIGTPYLLVSSNFICNS